MGQPLYLTLGLVAKQLSLPIAVQPFESCWVRQLLIDFVFNNTRHGLKIRFELKANIGNLCSDAGVEFACEDCKNETSRFSDLDFSGRMRIALSALLRQ